MGFRAEAWTPLKQPQSHLLTTQLEAIKRLTEGHISGLYKIRVRLPLSTLLGVPPSADIYQSLRRYKLEYGMLKDEFDLQRHSLFLTARMCLCENDFFFFFNTPTRKRKSSKAQAFIFQVILDKSNDRWSSVEPDGLA